MTKIFGKSYEKSSKSLFEKLKNNINDARIRAERLNNAALRCAVTGKELPFYTNPYVGILDLLNAIDNFE